MTIDEAIKLADALEPNSYPRDMKQLWLGMLDGRVYHEVLETHEDCPFTDFGDYENMPGDQPLLVPHPYDRDVYISFLQSRIALENGEAARYNRAVTLFNSAYEAYVNYYRRSHRPLSQGVFRL